MDENESKSQKRSIYDRFKKIPAIGILITITAAFFFSTNHLIVQLVNDLHVIELALIRSVLQTSLCALFILLFNGSSFRVSKDERLYVLLRCLFGSSSVICSFVSLRMIPLGDQMTLASTAPIFTSFMAHIFLRETCDVVNVIAVFITVVGVTFITKPSFIFGTENTIDGNQRLIGCLIAVVDAISQSLASVSIRKLKETPSVLVTFYSSTFLSFPAAMFLILTNQLKMVYGFRNIILVISIGICGTLGQLFVTLGLKLAEAAPAAVARTTGVVFAFVYQIFLLNEKVEISSAVGASIVMVGVFSVIIRQWIFSQNKNVGKPEQPGSDNNIVSVSQEFNNLQIQNHNPTIIDNVGTQVTKL